MIIFKQATRERVLSLSKHRVCTFRPAQGTTARTQVAKVHTESARKRVLSLSKHRGCTFRQARGTGE